MTLVFHDFCTMKNHLRNEDIYCRPVLLGDENELFPDEENSFIDCSIITKRQSASARLAARELLKNYGYERWSLPRRSGFAPLWPRDIVGSLAHCNEYAAASIKNAASYKSIGIDIEPSLPLPTDIRDIIIREPEKSQLIKGVLAGRVIFCAKEAAFKAAYSADGIPMDFYEIEVNLDLSTAKTKYGRILSIDIYISDFTVVLAKL